MPSLDGSWTHACPSAEVAFIDRKCAVASIGGDRRLEEVRVFFTILQGMAVDVYREEGQLELNTVAEECLWRAARAGNTTILLYLLLERQVDPNARRALHYARRHGQTEAISILVNHGAV
jgi:hypothetical protein